MKALIVDDEYPARTELRHLLSQCDCMKVIGEATNTDDAWQLINAVDYDVIFLDIKLPGTSGIELASRLKSMTKAPRLVFVTAFEDHAVKAFALGAFDYLLKPVSDERLRETIARLRKTLCEEAPPPKWLTGERNGIAVPVAVKDIVYAFAANNSTFVRTYADQVRIRCTMEQLCERLPNDVFFRSHRAYLVNVNKIKEIWPDVNGAYTLVMNDADHSTVTVSRGRVEDLKRRLGLQGRLRLRGGACARKKRPREGV
ncbi:MAG: LytTR family DNA-binding domain-containing protein [Thermoanaerobacterales bacterium]|nr:LytTR family DNA-binding domain-containing protein [Bacillota bacterium]MDI6907045.1 LytTR family DNA-binding domain-containing protein [Thermoanaerobacterales bacterium]